VFGFPNRFAGGLVQRDDILHIAPVPRRTHTANSCLPSSVAVVTQTWSPHTTGEDQPKSWMGRFQTTFSVSLQASGSRAASACPFARGLRNCGRCSGRFARSTASAGWTSLALPRAGWRCSHGGVAPFQQGELTWASSRSQAG
jgi:hypothetical protein